MTEAIQARKSGSPRNGIQAETTTSRRSPSRVSRCAAMRADRVARVAAPGATRAAISGAAEARNIAPLLRVHRREAAGRIRFQFVLEADGRGEAVGRSGHGRLPSLRAPSNRGGRRN
ncbi:hypothetical protein [Roseomonas sp. CECT 9278]|uniref:hypothetical protein n=1 Tax=Roseomonas sp. CECT 9278 TaxID=2845823 RepID=UPI001E2C2A22|nr:hypothetical protein [Roseomonas sp. CECT 9278]